MNQLKQQIKEGNFKPVYLLYGSQSYLKNLYRKKLTEAILPPKDTMNLTYLEGKIPDLPAIAELANTLPFFAKKRLIILENTGFFKSSCDLAKMLPDFPDTTILLFIENEVKKNTSMYKAVAKLGYACEMNGLSEKDLMMFLASSLNKEGLKISYAAAQHMLLRCGTDMNCLIQETAKLSAYCAGQEAVTIEDVDCICTQQISRQIFQMIDYIGEQKQNAALRLYDDLLALKEKPMSILALITRHFNKLLLVKDLSAKNLPKGEIAKKAEIPPFAVPKYQQQARSFSPQMLCHFLDFALAQEEKFKKGLMNDQMAVEIVIVYCSGKKRFGVRKAPCSENL